MWPPSSCPMGSRFIMVTSSPAQPAQAVGCRITSRPPLGSQAPLTAYFRQA